MNKTWLNLIVPIIFAAFLGIVGVVYDRQNDAIAQKADKEATTVLFSQMEKTLEEKVDNQVLLQMMKMEQQKLEQQKEQIVEQKKLNTDMLKELQKLNIQMKIIEHELKKEN